ncbi:hypothetical protein SAMN05421788_11298 [Filimonas lacunae]|uniref:Lipoprotein n=1 Tax=Filimonas lacunae TaxID=477680 RepID=A0A173MLD3_9BACT|nr:hypothetical protein [Filimonas lacunae]BAV08290.1 hypothetical protein FLA_4326 [Filimonas lacunae]SIT33268.1 hypothetical protein SAMN05421788_11298 [Filimonas lacunae]
MRKTCLAITLVLFSLAACKSKTAALDGDAPVTAKQLQAAFTSLKLPALIADSNANRLKDTTSISHQVLVQFVPDSVLTKLEGGSKYTAKTRINPLGKIEKENGTYLITTFTHNKRTSVAAFFFDKENTYKAALEILPAKRDNDYHYSVSINKEPTFTLNKERFVSASQLLYTRNGYAYLDGSTEFMMVINETNDEQKKSTDIYNPIDTLPRKNKFSGDYIENKKNFIAVRDGKNDQHYYFFIHFEKNNGACTGELKGEFTVGANNKAIYQQNGDPCVIDFSFSTGSISVKEQGSCGNHRGIRCLFNDSYTKKKEKKKK